MCASLAKGLYHLLKMLACNACKLHRRSTAGIHTHTHAHTHTHTHTNTHTHTHTHAHTHALFALQARLVLDLCGQLGLHEVILAGHADGSLVALKAISLLPE